MEYFSDLHIHSRFSRACSSEITIPNLEKWARIKGLNLLGTGDFTHPEWNKELKETLSEDGSGILKTKSGFNFVLQTEISLIYTDGGRGRRVHIIILAPDFSTVEKINSTLLTFGRLNYDGRPIFGVPCDKMVRTLISISERIEIIPAHAWTPWFSLFGSKSGFNSIKECFKEESKHIHAIETGLSSDPEMNWRISSLDRINPVSFSDSHSFWPWRMGREATVFDFEELTYDNLINAIRTGKGLRMTIEVDPAYGKYHVDGHRACNISLEPKESNKLNKICPSCRKPLTIGVLNRIEELADRKEGYEKPDNIPFLRLLPLHELISAVKSFPLNSKKTWEEYNKLIEKFGNEFNVLIKAEEQKISDISGNEIAKAVILNREGKIKVIPGYDGVYGVPLLGNMKKEIQKSEEKKVNIKKQAQKGLNDFFL